jgi:hypothetical protein
VRPRCELALISPDGKNCIGKSNRHAGVCVRLYICARTRRTRVSESGSVNDCALPSREIRREGISVFLYLFLPLSFGWIYVYARAKARRNVKRARALAWDSALHTLQYTSHIHACAYITYAYTPISRAIDGIMMRVVRISINKLRKCV